MMHGQTKIMFVCICRLRYPACNEGQIQKFSNSKCTSISASELFIIRNITDSCIAILGVFFESIRVKVKVLIPVKSKKAQGEIEV